MKRPWLVIGVLTLAASASFAADAGAGSAEAGRALYTKKCAMCHGADGVAKPTAKGSANLNDPEWQKATTDEAISDVIVHGKNKMPKSATLKPEEVRSLIAYVRTLK